MHLSKEVLNSIQKDLMFYNVDEIMIISDCLQVLNRKNNLSSTDIIYWLDYAPLNVKDFKKSKGILLVSNKSIRSYTNEQLNASKIITTKDPKRLFLTIDEYLRNETIVPEIHPTAQIHPNAILGENVLIGSGTVIEACQIGDNTVIQAHCTIGNGVKIGCNTVIHSGSQIGFNVFGFKKNRTGEWVKYQQIASVWIGDNVTIGSNTCINNGFIVDTIIKNDTFIDSLCQIGASVIIGERTIIAASSFIGANSKIGDRCWISPNVSIRENIEIVDDVFIGIGSVVLRGIKVPCRVFGIPAKLTSI